MGAFVCLAWLLAVILVVLGAILTIALYFALNSIESLRRRRLNIWMIVSIFLITFIIHYFCAVSAANLWGEADPSKILLLGLKEIYSAGGGLTFEGQSIAESSTLAAIIYYASIAWLAISNGLLISIGVSHQFYSWLYMRLRNVLGLHFFKKETRFFIFNFATKESLILADSLYEEYGKNCLIIFASDELGPFDRDNEIHRLIAEQGYLYIRLSKRKAKKSEKEKDFDRPVKGRPLIASLFHIHRNSESFLRFLMQERFHIFAFSNDEQLKGEESKNSDIVFDDIKNVIAFLPRKKFYDDGILNPVKLNDYCDSTLNQINYYILSNHDLNFEFYERTLQGLYGVNETKEVPTLTDIQIVNEAILAGEDLLHKRFANASNDPFVKKGSPYINEKENGNKVLVIGFGQNGEMALGHLFVSCAGGKTDEDGLLLPTPFKADIFDVNIEKVMGYYASTHPSFICYSEDKGEFIDLGAEDSLRLRYGKTKEEGEKEDPWINYEAHLSFPRLYFHQMNVNSKEFGVTAEKVRNGEYDSVVIALGDDELNIQAANMLLMPIRRDVMDGKKTYERLRFFIDIRNKDNKQRVIGYEDNIFNHQKGVDIYLFGSAHDIFSANHILIKDEAIGFHESFSKAKDHDDFKKKDAVTLKARHQYFDENDLYKRKSNENLILFSTVYNQIDDNVKKGLGTYTPYARYLSQVEHNRWCRHKWLYGALYTDAYGNSEYYDKTFLGFHKDLVPYTKDGKPSEGNDYLNPSKETYDYAIILKALDEDFSSLNNNNEGNKEV